MASLWEDLRYGLRMLTKDLGFTIVAVLTLALGVGVNTTVFSVAEAALLRSWPAKSPERLAKITATTPQRRDDYFSYPDYGDLSEQSRLLEGIVAYSRHAHILRVGSESKLLIDEVVSPNYFAVLGLHAERGRVISAEQSSAAGPAVVISDALWHRTFNADPQMIGKQISLTGRSYTVVGVAPPHFRGLDRVAPADLWLCATTDYGSGGLRDRGNRDFELLGRLGPGVTAEQARVELSTLGHRLAEAFPAIDKARDVGLISERERLREAAVPTLLGMAAVGLVLLICCANVAGLVLVRSEMRHREIAVRMALGARRARLVRQLLTEGALLASAGATLGLLLSSWLLTLQPALMPPAEVEIGFDLRLDAPVLLFAAVTSALTVLLFGMAPALQASKLNLVPALKGDEPVARRRARRFTLRSTLVLAEVALSVVLMTGSGLFLQSLLYTRGINLGFNPQKNFVFFDLRTGVADYDGPRTFTYLQQLREKAAGLPEVKDAAFALRVLLSDSEGGRAAPVSIPGVELPQGQKNIPIKLNAVSLGYLRTMGTRLLAGRDFSSEDSPAGARVVIINETMARHFWPDKNAVGEHITVDGKDCQIVGLVEDAKINQVHEAAEPYMYFPFAQHPDSEGTLIVETVGDPRPLITAIRREIRGTDPKVPIGIRTIHYLMQQAFWQDQMAAGFAGTLGLLGMFLAAVGLYGVIAYLVNRRRHELGIRMALGAERRDVSRLVLGQGLKLAALGTTIGLLASLGVTRLLSSLLYGVKPTDPVAFAGSAALVILVAAAASYFPARGATKVDPMVALRYE